MGENYFLFAFFAPSRSIIYYREGAKEAKNAEKTQFSLARSANPARCVGRPIGTKHPNDIVNYCGWRDLYVFYLSKLTAALAKGFFLIVTPGRSGLAQLLISGPSDSIVARGVRTPRYSDAGNSSTSTGRLEPAEPRPRPRG
jgi:hypothetical protein